VLGRRGTLRGNRLPLIPSTPMTDTQADARGPVQSNRRSTVLTGTSKQHAMYRAASPERQPPLLPEVRVCISLQAQRTKLESRVQALTVINPGHQNPLADSRSPAALGRNEEGPHAGSQRQFGLDAGARAGEDQLLGRDRSVDVPDPGRLRPQEAPGRCVGSIVSARGSTHRPGREEFVSERLHNKVGREHIRPSRH